MNAIFISFGKR